MVQLGHILNFGVFTLINTFPFFLSFNSKTLSQGASIRNWLQNWQVGLPQKFPDPPFQGSRQTQQKSGDLHPGHLTLLVFRSPLQMKILHVGHDFPKLFSQFWLNPSQNQLVSSLVKTPIFLHCLKSHSMRHLAPFSSTFGHRISYFFSVSRLRMSATMVSLAIECPQIILVMKVFQPEMGSSSFTATILATLSRSIFYCLKVMQVPTATLNQLRRWLLAMTAPSYDNSISC